MRKKTPLAVPSSPVLENTILQKRLLNVIYFPLPLFIFIHFIALSCSEPFGFFFKKKTSLTTSRFKGVEVIWGRINSWIRSALNRSMLARMIPLPASWSYLRNTTNFWGTVFLPPSLLPRYRRLLSIDDTHIKWIHAVEFPIIIYGCESWTWKLAGRKSIYLKCKAGGAFYREHGPPKNQICEL